MASIQAYGSKNHYHLFKLTLTETATSIEGNTSTIKFVFNLSEKSGYYFDWSDWGSSISYTITINGTKYTGTIPNYTPSTSGTNIKTGNLVISHDTNGAKEINYSFSVTDTSGASYTCGNASASGKMTLTELPRATTPTLSSSEIDLGETITISTPRAVDSFTHDLYYKVGTSAKIMFAEGVETSFDWSDNLFLANWINTSTSGTITIYCQTYNGDDYIGEKSVTFIGNVPSDIVPTIDTFTIEEHISDVATKIGKYLKGKSQLSINASASGDYASTIVSYRISANEETFTSSSAVTSVLKNSGTQTISVTVTDSRGRSVTREITINVVDYYSPKASGLSVYRCDSNGVLQDDGVYVKAYINYDIAPIENLNSKKASVQYLNGETWTTVATFTDTYSASSRNHVITNTQFDIDKTYEFKLVVEDYFSIDEWNALPLPTSYTLINYHASGKAMGFGKVATREEGFQFGDFIYDQFDTVITNGLAVYGGDPDTTLESLIMTSTNSPNGQAMFFHTFFSSNKSDAQNCGQLAVPYYYNGTQSLYWRYRFGGTWSEWKKLANSSEIGDLSDLTTNFKSNIVTAINEINDRQMITACISSEQEMSTSSSYQQISLDEIVGQVGDKFELAETTGLSENTTGIKIPSGVSKVKVSCNIQFANNNETSSMHFIGYIYNAKASGSGGVLISRSITPTIAKGTYTTSTTTPIIINVSENDVIYLRTYKNISSGVATIGAGTRTYLTVEKVE